MGEVPSPEGAPLGMGTALKLPELHPCSRDARAGIVGVSVLGQEPHFSAPGGSHPDQDAP